MAPGPYRSSLLSYTGGIPTVRAACGHCELKLPFAGSPRAAAALIQQHQQHLGSSVLSPPWNTAQGKSVPAKPPPGKDTTESCNRLPVRPESFSGLSRLYGQPLKGQRCYKGNSLKIYWNKEIKPQEGSRRKREIWEKAGISMEQARNNLQWQQRNFVQSSKGLHFS